MRLAEHVAHTVHVDQMLDSMTPQEFDEWVAKDRVEPIGNEQTRHVLALIGAVVAGFAGVKNIGPEDFMPWAKSRKAKMSHDEIMTAAASIPGAIHGVRG